MQGFKSLLVAALALVGATPVVAQELILESQHQYFESKVSKRDKACQTEALKALGKRFEGINSLTITASNYWTSTIVGIENYAFPDSRLSSEHGDVAVEVLCMVSTEKEEIIEISFQFNPALKGGRNASPYTTGSSMLVWQTPTEFTGDS
ncbi:hypothetical protein VWX97_01090 [Phaeobacter sp. JH18-32]|uniref:hypothetical protein n=1 Tax=Phaeobacter TaxID=302485 RepID=UPI003A89542D